MAALRRLTNRCFSPLPIPARYSLFPLSFHGGDLEGLHDCQHPTTDDSFSVLRASVESKTDESSISHAIIGSKTEGFEETTLRQYKGRLSQSLVIQLINLAPNSESCVKFFMWAGRQIGYSHTAPVYDALLQRLQSGGDRNSRIPGHLLHEIGSDDREVLGKLLNLLIRKHCQNRWWNSALEELGRLKDYGHRPTSVTYNTLVQVFVKADNLDTARLVLREMSESGFRMDEFTLGCFAQALCRAGKWREALALIEKHEFVADTVLYTKMVSGLCEASLFDEAMDFLDRMRSASCLPNDVTYRVFLRGCLREKQLGRCKRILRMMTSEGFYPHPTLFNALVHAYCRSEDYSYAYKLLREMAKCGCQPGYVVYNIFIGGICSKEELPSSEVLDLAEKAYVDMLNVGVVLNKVNVINFSRCLCGAGKFERAYSVISDMMSKGFVPDTSTYSKVVKFLCSSSKIEKAYSLFEEMKRNSVVPDVYTYTILIDSFCKAGLILQARKLFNEMVENGCSPNVVTFTALMHGYLKARKVFDADTLFEMMLRDGCVPNVVTYTALIDGHCKAGKAEKALLIYERMTGKLDSSAKEVYFKTGERAPHEPDVFMYGALVDGLCKAHRVKEASDLVNTMLNEGCKPNNIVYDALIDGFCKTGKLEEAQSIFSNMSDYTVSPTVFTYGSLIDRLFKDKRLDLVLKVLSKMQEDSCLPNVVIYTQMIDGLCKVGKIDEAYKLLLMMEQKKCDPNVVTYTTMIDGFGKAGKVDKCFHLLGEMCKKGCAPNFVTYRVLINSCCSVGLLDEARKLLEEMMQTYWPKHVASYRKVIEGYSREFLGSIGILNELTEYESVPVCSAYCLLIEKYIKAGKLEEAMELYSEISSSFRVSNQTWALLIESLSSGNKVGKGFQVFTDMLNGGGAPELTTLVHLIRGLARVDRWDDAFWLSDSICQMDIHWLQPQEDHCLSKSLDESGFFSLKSLS